jgi:hypothetical protein
MADITTTALTEAQGAQKGEKRTRGGDISIEDPF